VPNEPDLRDPQLCHDEFCPGRPGYKAGPCWIISYPSGKYDVVTTERQMKILTTQHYEHDGEKINEKGELLGTGYIDFSYEW
jgi:hypothetical protein